MHQPFRSAVAGADSPVIRRTEPLKVPGAGAKGGKRSRAADCPGISVCCTSAPNSWKEEILLRFLERIRKARRLLRA